MFDIEKLNICDCETSCEHLVHRIESNGLMAHKEIVYCELSLKERLMKCPVWERELLEKAHCRCIVEPVCRWEIKKDSWIIRDNVTGKMYDTDSSKGVNELVRLLNKELGYD